MNEKTQKFISTFSKWAFLACCVITTVIICIDGHASYAVWPILAGAFYWLTCSLQEQLEDAVEYGDAMSLRNLEVSHELCKAQLKIHELEEQLKTLKK